MISGLLSLSLVAKFLHKSFAGMRDVLEGEDAIPFIKINAKTKPVLKVPFGQFLGWLNKRSNTQWTAKELEAELERCHNSKKKGKA